MNDSSLSLAHRLREIRSAALDVHAPAAAKAPGRTSVAAALRDRVGRALVGVGEALLAGGPQRVRVA